MIVEVATGKKKGGGPIRGRWVYLDLKREGAKTVSGQVQPYQSMGEKKKGRGFGLTIPRVTRKRRTRRHVNC